MVGIYYVVHHFANRGLCSLTVTASALKPQLSPSADQPVGFPLVRIDTFPFTRSKKPGRTCSVFSPSAVFSGLSLICVFVFSIYTMI